MGPETTLQVPPPSGEGVRLDDLRPLGNPRLLGKTLSRNAKGGYVSVQIAAVHTYACKFWRQGKRHGPCTCGALDEFAALAGEAVSPTREKGN
jgi:hypothetical protein